MFTIAFLFVIAAQRLSQAGHGRKALVFNLFLIFTIIFLRIHFKKEIDYIHHQQYVLQTRQEITTTDGSASDEH